MTKSKKFYLSVFTGVVFLLSGSCATLQETGDTRDEILKETFSDEGYSQETQGYTYFKGISSESPQGALWDAMEKLLLNLGVMELSVRSTNDARRVFHEFESSNGVYSQTVTSGEYSQARTESGRTVLPMVMIQEWRTKNFYYCRLSFKNEDKEKIMNLMQALMFFPPGEEETSLSAYYYRRIMVLKTMLSSRQAADLAGRLENEFFIQTAVRDNTVFIFPRDLYENRVLVFLQNCFDRVEKANGNEVNLREPRFDVFARNSLALRNIAIKSNVPLPELHYVFRQNGLDIADLASVERFLCTVEFTANERSYSTAFQVEVKIFDKKNDQVLLSHTLISPYFQKYTQTQIMAAMKNELVKFLEATLPQILIVY